MGHHLTDDDPPKFQSDLHPELDLNQIALHLDDPEAAPFVRAFAHWTADEELGDDLLTALENLDVDENEDLVANLLSALENTEPDTVN